MDCRVLAGAELSGELAGADLVTRKLLHPASSPPLRERDQQTSYISLNMKQSGKEDEGRFRSPLSSVQTFEQGELNDSLLE